MLGWLRRRIELGGMPPAARAAAAKDARGLPAADPGIDRVVEEGIAWLGRAQDNSASSDGGVARDYSLVKGWATSYPETTGYIVPTMLDHAAATGSQDSRDRARRMLDWLLAIQYPEGGFMGGRIDAKRRVPVTFNTGQILMGLAAGTAAFGAPYREAMGRAARWLVDTQDPDGAWRRYATPFAKPGEKAYETHVAWGLLEAARMAPDHPAFADAALRNVRWALGKQQANGWIADCCLDDPARPLTHTLGYALRGIVEAYLYFKEPELLAAARRTADGLRGVLGPDGRLPGRLTERWTAAVDWVCLTGAVQVAHSWLLLYRETAEPSYREAAFAANRFVRRTVAIDGPPETRGAVKGAFPVWGDYGRFECLNWAVKFAIDSNVVERAVRHDA